MKKGGQATLFVIVGFLLLLSLSLGYYTLTVRQTGIKAQAQETPVTQTTLPVKYLVDKCLSLIVKNGVTFLGKKGGYITSRPTSLTNNMIRLTEKEELAYFYLRNGNSFQQLSPQEYLPTIEYMQKELETYVKNEIRYCLDDFEFFATKGIDVKMEKMTTKATIAPKAVTVDLYFPVTVQTDEKIIQVKDFTITLPVRLGEIRNVAEKIVQETKSYEQKLHDLINERIRTCNPDVKPGDISEERMDHILPLCSDNPATRSPSFCIIQHKADPECEKEIGFCAPLSLQITVRFPPLPLPGCKTVTTEEHLLWPLVTVYGILDYEAPQDPYTFLFMTKINVDTKETCNKC